MITIRGYAARSRIHGFGIFTKKKIPAGTKFELVFYRYRGMDGSLNCLVDGNIAPAGGRCMSVYTAVRGILPGEELTVRETEAWMLRHLPNPILHSWEVPDVISSEPQNP